MFMLAALWDLARSEYGQVSRHRMSEGSQTSVHCGAHRAPTCQTDLRYWDGNRALDICRGCYETRMGDRGGTYALRVHVVSLSFIDVLLVNVNSCCD